MQPAKSEIDEWQSAVKRGRKSRLPAVAGAIAFAVVFAGILIGLGSLWAGADEAAEADKQARLARGETVIEIHRRGSTKESRAANSLFVLVLIAAAAGAGAGATAFVATGGKLSPEHRRALGR